MTRTSVLSWRTVLPHTEFTDPTAVEAWDAWFRWRDGSGLRDRTIEDTWWRVANALAAAEGAWAPLFAHHFVNAFSRWWMLPDERLLQYAGTETPTLSLDRPAAVLNVAPFVNSPQTRHARFDRDRFVATAGLAVRLLDNAVTLFSPPQAPATALFIGVVGLADALHQLACPYTGTQAEAFARDVALALAEGCMRGSITLADERGSRLTAGQRQDRIEHLRSRGLPEPLLQDALRHGFRHTALTALEPHPRLAALADNVADGAAPRTSRHALSSLADGPLRRHGDPLQVAHRTLLAAMQPWMDAPLGFPTGATPLRAEDIVPRRIASACGGGSPD